MTSSGRRGAALPLVVALVGLAGLIAGCSTAGNPTNGPANGSASPVAGTSGQPRPTTQTVRQVNVSISDAGCGPQNLSEPAGPTTFIVTNTGSSNVLEYEIEQDGRIIGEVENVIPGIDRTFTLNLKPGAYVLNCPGGTSTATGTLTVTE